MPIEDKEIGGRKKKVMTKKDNNMKKVKKQEQVAKEKTKREKKVYDLPGQKRDPPDERDPLRIFYETLYNQVPVSDMAAIWMMESGLLPKDEANKVLERKQKRAQKQNLISPVKTVDFVKKKKNKLSDSVTSVEKKSFSLEKPISNPTETNKTTPPDSKTAESSKQKTKKRKSKDGDDHFVSQLSS